MRDKASEAKAADRGFEQLGLDGGGAKDVATVRPQQLEIEYVATERSCPMVIFPVHVVGDRTAYGDESSSRRNRYEPATGYDQIENIRQEYARFTRENARDR